MVISYFQNFPAKRTCAIYTSTINRITYTKRRPILYLGVATVSCSKWTRISATILLVLSLNALCIIIPETFLALRRARGCPYNSKRGKSEVRWERLLKTSSDWAQRHEAGARDQSCQAYATLYTWLHDRKRTSLPRRTFLGLVAPFLQTFVGRERDEAVRTSA